MDNLQVIEVKGIRALTTKQIAELYKAAEWQVKQNFQNNKKNYIEGKHYIVLTGEELRNFKNKVENFYPVGKTANKLYLWTEKGALLHAKSLNTDKAWEVYDYLVDFYFRVKEETEQQAARTKLVPVEKKATAAAVINIRQNAKAQEKIRELRKNTMGIDAILDILEMPQSEESCLRKADTMKMLSFNIAAIISSLEKVIKNKIKC